MGLRGDNRAVTPEATVLSRDNAVTVGVALLDARGPQALTMRALAREMGVPVMSLYRHVESREDLERAIVARLVADLDIPPDGRSSWEGFLRAWGKAFRKMLRSHPNAAQLLASFPVSGYGARAEDVEWVLATLGEAGLPPQAARVQLRAAIVAVTGFCTAQGIADNTAGADPGAAPPAGDFPLLAPLMDDLRERRDGDAVFEAMLDGVVAGVHSAIAGR